MRNSSLAHLLNPDVLYSQFSLSLFAELFKNPFLYINVPHSQDNFIPLISSTLGDISRKSHSRKRAFFSHKAPFLLAILALFCLGMGLGIQQIFPNTQVQEQEIIKLDSQKSRLGACTISKDKINLDLTLQSSPRIQIYIKQFGGEVVYRRDVNLGRQKKLNMDIDLTVLPDGLYMLKVESGDQQMVRLITRS